MYHFIGYLYVLMLCSIIFVPVILFYTKVWRDFIDSRDFKTNCNA